MSESPPPMTCQRALFDVPDGVLYLNAASKSALLSSSVAAGEIGAAAKGRPWLIDEAARHAEAERVRAGFAALIGAQPGDIAIQPSAAYGAATAARNLNPPAGSKILVLEGQYPSNVYAWKNLARDAGARLETVAWPADDDWTSAVLAAIDGDVAIAALPPCHWTDGAVLDLGAISAALRPAGAALVVDATQWIGAVPFDVAEIDADFVLCAAYKWLLGPYGLGLFYAHPRHHGGRPLEDHLFNHGGLASITGGLSYPDGFTDGARRFDAGQYMNLVSLPMIADSLRHLNDWQPARIAAYLKPVTEALAGAAEDLGLTVTPPGVRSPHILGVRRPGGFADDAAAALAKLGVHVSARGGAIRLSPHVFNEIADSDRFAAAMQKLL